MSTKKVLERRKLFPGSALQEAPRGYVHVLIPELVAELVGMKAVTDH